ncbi:uncharacterized protein CMU_012840 [Cryptosporidium muris RN66]|uniref:Saccharopine dehydrogenase NADP binding domain-containing protein n=1 Tax=Cryptosporidium muris (strain RN66) TaxID=441375 RepID=B6AEJ3_CRYMR|nr:uncharacterized protein CMU_012840 [Cryptosporidium muris RN66]EEA06610.1 hypothetical protein, conserved [Cryptosporidium muris RN66]|eukprot:XP_002140959.1 hypothetical protein [Cryptosporidium muris RN66]
MSTIQKQYDLFVWGCTGYTGHLVCELLVKAFGSTTSLKYCLGGRDMDKMENLRNKLIRILDVDNRKGEKIISTIPMFQCTTEDELRKCISNSKVCLNLAGPYLECGEIIVRLCAENYTNYVDITGELYWIRKIQRMYGISIASKNLKFVVCSGFIASISDLGLLHLQNFATSTSGFPCQEVKHYFRHEGHSQEFSSGTIHSMINLYKSLTSEELTEMGNPYYLCSGTLCLSNINEIMLKNREVIKPIYDEKLESWTSPMVMSSTIDQFVHFSNEEMGYPYGMDFIFSVRNICKSYLEALKNSIMIKVSPFLIQFSLLISKLKCGSTYVSGFGPDTTKAHDTVLEAIFLGHTLQGKHFKCIVQLKDCEAYVATAKTALSSVLALIHDEEALPPRYGISTPACLLGTTVIKYCQDLGMQFDTQYIQE